MILNFLNFIDESYLRGISKLKPSFFCFLFNLRQLLIFRKSTIFHFSKKQNLFYAKEKGLTIYFFSPYRQARLYSRGIKNRLKIPMRINIYQQKNILFQQIRCLKMMNL